MGFSSVAARNIPSFRFCRRRSHARFFTPSRTIFQRHTSDVIARIRKSPNDVFGPTCTATFRHTSDLATSALDNNIPRQKLPGHLQSISPPRGVFDLVGLDFWGPTKEPSTNLNRYVLVLTDYMSKFVVARATPLNNPQTVAEFLLETASTFGVPHQLLTD